MRGERTGGWGAPRAIPPEGVSSSGRAPRERRELHLRDGPVPLPLVVLAHSPLQAGVPPAAVLRLRVGSEKKVEAVSEGRPRVGG